MAYRFTALMFLVLGIAMGAAVVLASGANAPWKYALGFGVPTGAGALLAIVWWRQGHRAQTRAPY